MSYEQTVDQWRDKCILEQLEECFAIHPHVVFINNDYRRRVITGYSFLNKNKKSPKDTALRISFKDGRESFNRQTIKNGHFNKHFIFYNGGQCRLAFYDLKEVYIS